MLGRILYCFHWTLDSGLEYTMITSTNMQYVHVHTHSEKRQIVCSVDPPSKVWSRVGGALLACTHDWHFCSNYYTDPSFPHAKPVSVQNCFIKVQFHSRHSNKYIWTSEWLFWAVSLYNEHFFAIITHPTQIKQLLHLGMLIKFISIKLYIWFVINYMADIQWTLFTDICENKLHQ